MKNYSQRGDIITVTVGADVASGGVVVVGDLVGVAVGAAANGTQAEVCLTGVFELAKVSGAINQGVKVYWSAADSAVTTTASTNKLVGHAFVGAASGDATVLVKLAH